MHEPNEFACLDFEFSIITFGMNCHFLSGMEVSFAQLMLPLAFLAPSIVTAIFESHHPADLSLGRLNRRTTVALDRSAQRHQLGFTG
ncbi:MAG: hypothetical protein ACKVP4_00890 [Hyphomicrobium sp.]